MAHQGDGESVLEIDLGRLGRRMATKCRAPVPGEPLQVDDVVQPLQQQRLAHTGSPAQCHRVDVSRGPRELLDEEAAHGLVTAPDAWIYDASGLVEPLLGDLRAHAPAEAVEHAVRVLPGEVLPGGDAFFPDLSVYQLVAQIDGGILAQILVADADLVTLRVVDEGMVLGCREGTLVEFHRGAHVEQGRTLEKKTSVVVDQWQFHVSGRELA